MQPESPLSPRGGVHFYQDKSQHFRTIKPAVTQNFIAPTPPPNPKTDARAPRTAEATTAGCVRAWARNKAEKP